MTHARTDAFVSRAIDRGQGPPVVLVPGIQGRWEWMEPAVAALSRRWRVLTFSLGPTPPDDFWTGAIDALLDRAGEPAAALVGVSYGGLVAVRYAAVRPARTRALVLVSTPAPDWRPDARTAAYVRRPRLALPVFAVRAGRRLLPEIVAARPTWAGRARLLAAHLGRIALAPLSPSAAAGRVERWLARDLAADARRVTAPTLLVTGEPHLDRVVPVAATLAYRTLIPGARHATLPGTGHIGLISKPEAFADLVGGFLAAAAEPAGAGGPLASGF